MSTSLGLLGIKLRDHQIALTIARAIACATKLPSNDARRVVADMVRNQMPDQSTIVWG